MDDAFRGGPELNETIIEGAKREVMEETGCDVEITGLCGIFHYQLAHTEAMSVRFCFNCKLISENKDAVLAEDILSYDWKTRDEVQKVITDGKLRSRFAEEIIPHYFSGKNYPLDLLNEI